MFFFLFISILQVNATCCLDLITNSSGTGDILAYPLLLLLITFFVCKVVKSYTKKNSSMIQQYQTTTTESSANGRIHTTSHVAIVLLVFACLFVSVIREVSIFSTMKMTLNLKIHEDDANI